ncbi:MAG: hypothetical protein M3Y33_05640 [Actinomycetota bacterium]|nr:hypothetical protein [Actinomycetota bacterium]
MLLGDPTLFSDAAGIERTWGMAAALLEAPPVQRSDGRCQLSASSW